MTSKMQAALSAVAVAVVTALVAFGVVGGEQASAVQGVLLTVIAFVATIGIRSALPPKN
jgi:branched-subunit amino acid transport protein